MSDIDSFGDSFGDSFANAIEAFREAYKSVEKEMDDLVEKTDDETKIAVVRWAMKHIVDHAREGGTFRYLIYDRLGFGPEAYMPLCTDGMTISNEFDMEKMDRISECVKENKYEKLKPLLYMCSHSDCYNDAVAYYPGAKEGEMVSSCSEHYKRDEQ